MNLMNSEFHCLLHGAALDDGKVHARCKRRRLAELGETFAMAALRTNELAIHADEMYNIIAGSRSSHHQSN